MFMADSCLMVAVIMDCQSLTNKGQYSKILEQPNRQVLRCVIVK